MTDAEQLAFDRALTLPFAEGHRTVKYYVRLEPELVRRDDVQAWMKKHIDACVAYMKSDEYAAYLKARKEATMDDLDIKYGRKKFERWEL